MTTAFVSYHHARDQHFKDHLVWLAQNYGAFEDRSVNTGDIDDDARSSESIRQLIRDEYLRDSEVTILLCGRETRHRKHVDWELKSSMIDGRVNKKSGILVINVDGANTGNFLTALPHEQEAIYPYHGGWLTLETKGQFEAFYPDLPARIMDNIVNPNAAISIVPWEQIYNQPGNLKWLVDQSALVAKRNEYDLSKPMRRQNYTPRQNAAFGSVFG